MTHTQTCRARRDKLDEAVRLGYLGHERDCQKGITSDTCTCGVMAWLPEATVVLYACDCDAAEGSAEFRRRAGGTP